LRDLRAHESHHVGGEIDDRRIDDERANARVVHAGADDEIAAEADAVEREVFGRDLPARKRVVDHRANRLFVIGPEREFGMHAQAAKDGGHARGSSLPMAARAAKISPTSPPPKLAAPSERMSWKSISGLWNPAIRVRVRSTRDMAKY